MYTHTEKMFQYGINYQFPICYPDWGMAQLLYFKRIRSNLFYDYTFTTDKYSWHNTYTSLGVEIFSDMRWWNQLSLSLGFRYSRQLQPLPGKSANKWELILPMSLY